MKLPNNAVSVCARRRVYIPKDILPVEEGYLAGHMMEGEIYLYPANGATERARVLNTDRGGAHVYLARIIREFFQPEIGYYRAELVDDVLCINLEGGPL